MPCPRPYSLAPSSSTDARFAVASSCWFKVDLKPWNSVLSCSTSWFRVVLRSPSS